ncbi:PREDICTED: uncharacterized protein LOC109125911 [Camelina sativa]|uniref:Uncharacterized protein LOC109125911 n=1 Tax=Camelina sativa TaxID=90675 RepID=A0ABM1QBW5_CAMSA|nr:PREDICTED: uncharacterized protein LOC109125911 [Camelina sativa]
MVNDAFHETTAAFPENNTEEPNVDAQRFYTMLDAANQPIYDGCREGHSKLSLASRMMTIKADNNLSENCMDSWAELIKEYLSADNMMISSKNVGFAGSRDINLLNEGRECHINVCDGFSPFVMSGRQYSLWPVQSIRSEPLIHELKQLWYEGVQTFDLSRKQNFNMRAVLMWTISDSPAYGMLSGWTTHGRLSCPYCMDRTDAFQLKYRRKPCWFDCHRRFLPLHHPYRKNKKLFRKNKVVRVPPPTYVSGNDLFEQIDYYGAQETCKRGGNYHTPANMPDGYGSAHNWHKQSIFWELPYWKDLLLRHNLDVMHIEKIFFDNFIVTLLNVQGKTKDSWRSRLDLAEICARIDLHLTRDGKLPLSQFRLSAEDKKVLFEWIKSEVKFPDGFVSKFSRCVEQGQKISGI